MIGINVSPSSVREYSTFGGSSNGDLPLGPSAINPRERNTIADYEYLLHKLNQYDIAFLEIIGPAVGLAATLNFYSYLHYQLLILWHKRTKQPNRQNFLTK
jgi:hypothetical protein